MNKTAIPLVLAGMMSLGVLGGMAEAAGASGNKAAHGRGGPADKVIMDMVTKRAAEFGISAKGKDFPTLVREIRVASLNKEAAALGISTKGKDLQALFQEVMSAKLKSEAAQLGIPSAGKDLRVLGREVAEARVRKDAADLGIPLEGKDLRAVAREVRDAKISKVATKLGIDTAKKTSREVFREILKDHPTEAKELMGRGRWQMGGMDGPRRHSEGHWMLPRGSEQK